MWQQVIVGVLMLVAGVALAIHVVRVVRGRSGSGCAFCGQRTSCSDRSVASKGRGKGGQGAVPSSAANNGTEETPDCSSCRRG